MAMIITMKSTFTDHGLCAEGHGAEPSTSIILMFMLSDCAFLVYYRNWSLGRSRHIPRVTELVGAGGLDSHPGHLPPGHSQGRGQAEGLEGPGMEKERARVSLGSF